MESLLFWGSIVLVLLIAFMAMGFILARLYRRSTKEVSYVRTGFRGQKVILNGGALVLPILHETIPVNMQTLRLEVSRTEGEALITKNRMRVDVKAEFYVRVKPDAGSIAMAAQTLGRRTMDPNDLKNLVEGKFVDSLRAVAAEMAMEELHEKRSEFVQKVQMAVSEDLLKNGLELETVSLTGLDQTDRKYFNPDNAFDAEGLTELTKQIENKRRERNNIERDTQVSIAEKDLEAERKRFDIAQDSEFARLSQEREVETKRAEQAADIARQKAARKREAEEAEIQADREVSLARLQSEQEVGERDIAKTQALKAKQIEQDRALETANIERKKTIDLAGKDSAIAVAQKSKEESEEQAKADAARALAVKAQEMVITARETAVADRSKEIELIRADENAQRDAIKVKVEAATKKEAADNEAAAILTLAKANADEARIKAEGDAKAETVKAEAKRAALLAEAEGNKAMNEAENVLSADIIALRLKDALIRALPQIAAELVKPAEKIGDIRMVSMDGMGGIMNGATIDADGKPVAAASGGLVDEMVKGIMKFRTQGPMLDMLMKSAGIADGATPDGIAKAVTRLMAEGDTTVGTEGKEEAKDGAAA